MPFPTHNLEKEAAQLLTKLEKQFNTTSFSARSDTRDNLSDEFVSLCLQARTTLHSDVIIVLQQMNALLETLPPTVLVQHPDGLTLRTLLQVALETQRESPHLRCHTLGLVQLVRGQANEKDARTAEAQSELLTFFLLQPRRFWTDEQIFDALWPQKNLTHAQWSFHTARKRLHDFAGEEVILKLKRGQYGLNPYLPTWFDVAEFESLHARAQTIANSTARVKLLESAVRLYRGDFLEKNYKEWVAPVRTRLREKYIGALLQLGELNQREAPAQAIGWYEKALHADDLNEECYVKLIELHAQCNNLISAQRTYVLCLDTFRRELGTKPSAAFLHRVRALIGDTGFKMSVKDE